MPLEHVMSDLSVAATAEILAAELGQPYAVVRWTPPLVSSARPPAAMRRALGSLDEQGGGLLVAHVVRDALGLHARASDTRAALVAALGDALLAEVHAVRCADGLAVVARVVSTAAVAVPPDLVPVDGAGIYDLRSGTASRVAPIVGRPALDAVDDGLGPDERALVAGGVLAVVDGDLIPTVAGLVVFGRAPWEHLGGLRVEVSDGDRDTIVIGDGVSLPANVTRALRLHWHNAAIVGSLVTRALVGRVWSPYAEDEPIVVRRDGRDLDVRWPSADDDTPNPTLRKLLGAASARDALAEDPARLGERVERLGGVWDGEEVHAGDVVVRLTLPPDVDAPTKAAPRVLQNRPAPTTVQEAPKRVLLEAPRPPATAVPRSATAPTSPATRRTDPAPMPVPVPSPRPTAPAAPPVATQPHIPAASREAAVLALLDTRGQITTRDVIEGLGWTRSTTRDVMARLVSSGAIVSVAPSARSPSQAYVRRTG
jgi:hypothetical protein